MSTTTTAASTERPTYEAVPAGTVVLIRDGEAGLEVLMLRRASTLAFAAGSWVFPGGKVEQSDWERAGLTGATPGAGYLGEQNAARYAAAREAEEEAGVFVDPAALIPFAHWLPPATAPKRFSTWFFLARGGTADVNVDGGEITTHTWARPDEVLRRRDAGDLTILPPTWVTLWSLAHHTDVASALSGAQDADPTAYRPQVRQVAGIMTCLYAEDACYLDAASSGPRHRLVMDPSGWRYERTFSTD